MGHLPRSRFALAAILNAAEKVLMASRMQLSNRDRTDHHKP
jgi:hypothetical protein